MNALQKNKSVGSLRKSGDTLQKSLLERIEKNIPDGRYKGLSKILEPHEIPKRSRP
jgi:hypothetical protein